MSQFQDYFLDQTNENSRLLRRHEHAKALVGGLLPPEIDAAAIGTALDLACGPGGWALDFARAYPQAQVIGVDASEAAVSEAERLALRDRLGNVRFREINIIDKTGLPFADASFDLVWACLVFFYLPVAAWEPLLRQAHRILRPNGALVILDGDLLAGSTSSQAYRRLQELLATMLIKNGCLPRFGPLAPGLLRRTGFERIYTHPLLQVASFQEGDQPIPEDICRRQANVLGGLYKARGALLSAGLVTAEEFDRLYETASQQIAGDPDQVIVEIGFMVSGRKPA